MSRHLNRLAAAIAAALLALSVPATTPASASVTAKVSGTEGLGLFVRPTPDQSGAPITTLPEGTSLRLQCWVHGQTIAGYWYTGDTWHRITSPAVGYVSDTYVYTGTNGPAPGEPRCSGGGPASGGPSRPMGEVPYPAPGYGPTPPKKPNRSGSLLKDAFIDLISGCAAVGWKYCAGLGLHYLDRSGAPVGLPIGDLLWQQRPAWASLEWQLRHNAQQALDRARSTPARSSATVPFDTGWYGYNATGRNDWHYALGHFSIRLRGDLWIGPADGAGNRSVQLRYRTFLWDVYDFRGGEFSRFAALHDQGRAAEFLVTGAGRTIRRQFTTATMRPGSLGLEW